MRPSLAIDRISWGFWLNISFVVNYRGAFRSIVAIAIDVLTPKDRYFLWITAVPLPRRCLQSRQHSGSACAVLNSRWAGNPICNPSRIIATSFSYCSINPLRPQIVFTFSPTCRACTNSIAVYLITMRDFIFLCIGPHQQSAISSGWLW